MLTPSLKQNKQSIAACMGWGDAPSNFTLKLRKHIHRCSPASSAPPATPQAMPDKGDTPSNFTLKLRKHIRTRRLERVTQLGVDRVVALTFGTGEAAHHLLLEFYAQASWGWCFVRTGELGVALCARRRVGGGWLCARAR